MYAHLVQHVAVAANPFLFLLWCTMPSPRTLSIQRAPTVERL